MSLPDRPCLPKPDHRRLLQVLWREVPPGRTPFQEMVERAGGTTQITERISSG